MLETTHLRLFVINICNTFGVLEEIANQHDLNPIKCVLPHLTKLISQEDLLQNPICLALI